MASASPCAIPLGRNRQSQATLVSFKRPPLFLLQAPSVTPHDPGSRLSCSGPLINDAQARPILVFGENSFEGDYTGPSILPKRAFRRTSLLEIHVAASPCRLPQPETCDGDQECPHLPCMIVTTLKRLCHCSNWRAPEVGRSTAGARPWLTSWEWPSDLQPGVEGQITHVLDPHSHTRAAFLVLFDLFEGIGRSHMPWINKSSLGNDPNRSILLIGPQKQHLWPEVLMPSH